VHAGDPEGAKADVGPAQLHGGLRDNTKQFVGDSAVDWRSHAAERVSRPEAPPRLDIIATNELAKGVFRAAGFAVPLLDEGRLPRRGLRRSVAR